MAFLDAVCREEYRESCMKVVMIGADRSVKGGVSAVVNNLYGAGLDKRVGLTYIGTMVDGSKIKKAGKAALALLQFTAAMPGTDLVHVNMAADASCRRKMIFMRIARFFHKKIVLHEHGGDFQGFYEERCSEKQRRKVKKALNDVDLFLVLSDDWKQFFSAIVEPSRIHVLQNCVPVPERKKTDYSSHSVLFLGRLCKEKGIGELLEAVCAVKRAVPDFKLILGGFWEEGSGGLQERAARLGDTVECPGWVSPKRREELFEECSIFVLPTWFEGQPVSLLEAMAAGMCAAASGVGGIPEILADGTGVLLEPKNPERLAKELIRLLQDETLRRRLGERAHARICLEYDITRYVDRLTGYYESVTGRRI